MKLLILCVFCFVLGMISGAVAAFKSEDDGEAMMEDKWIPVGERLPEEGETVLGWIERDSWGEEEEPERVREYAIGWHVNGLWHFNGYMSKGTDCLAWMPLPYPYEEDE